MNRLLAVFPRNLDLALLILRVVVGVVFMMHGWQKLFQYGIAGVTGSFEGMGVPLPGIAAPFVSVLEFAGGILLILGALTPLVAALLAINMLVAVLLVHLKAGFFLPNGYEFALTLMAASLALMLTGAGAYSVDGRLGKRGPARS